MEDCAPGYYPIALGGGKYSVTNDAVAYVEDIDLAYKDFEDAVESTKSNSVEDKTIKLLKDITKDYVLSVGETLKVEKDGHKITVKAPSGL